MDAAEYALGIAHDLRNLVLFPLSAYVDLAQRALQAGDLSRGLALLAEMSRALAHGEATIERLRRDRTAPLAASASATDLDALSLRAVELARARIRDGATTLVVPPGSAGTLRVDANDVLAAVVNLVANAIDALAGTRGGTVTVRTGGDASAAWIEVADDGPGIAPELRARLFEPFVTTKAGPAFGVGLAMVRACAERHGGTVELDSAPGRGARFTLRLPRC